ncbi:MAG: hypothetical protein JXL20_11330 [Deltaproteobacteria bacterium]|nr:hypothetical protein [Deltaproteobacteria bacterium]
MNEFHMTTALSDHIDRYGDRTAIRYRQNDAWREMSWNRLGEQVREAAKGLLAMGVKEGVRIGEAGAIQVKRETVTKGCCKKSGRPENQSLL